jgi:23S rRNA (adenine2030-N6)-methyltransferase
VNYRHAFHAGNFADVHKHLTLVALIERLGRKPTACLLLDTHAGRGWYDLNSGDATRGNEWSDGIGRLRAATAHSPIQHSQEIQRYLAAVGVDRTTKLSRYPGSPALLVATRRGNDRVVLVERQPEEARALELAMRGERNVSVVAGDGYAALKAWLPPKENRGLVLIDPPYEADSEFRDVEQALTAALARWPNGVFMVWYPLKAGGDVRRFHASLKASGLRKLLRLDLSVRPTDAPIGINGSGVLIANPPWRFEVEMREALTELHAHLSQTGAGGVEVEWVVPE